MLSEFLKNILHENSHYLSLSELESSLQNKKTRIKISNYLSHSSLYTVSDGFVFMKKALLDMKKDFLDEFEEYVSAKSIDYEAAINLRTIYAQYIPDSLYPEWFSAPLETKLLIFDLLLSCMVRNPATNDPLKKYFFELIEVYSLLAIYSLILVKTNPESYETLTNYLNMIDPDEEIMKNLIYEVLIDPLEVQAKLAIKCSELQKAQEFIDKTIDASFRVSITYSKHLFSKVVSNELKKFEPIQILSRFAFETLYEWLLVIMETQEIELSERLLEDLDL